MEELKCSVCGSPVNAGDSFCQNCGNPIQPQKQEETGIPESSQPVSGVTEPTSVVMPEVTEPTVTVTPEITEPTPVVETTETIEAVQPTYEAVSAQPEEKPANPFTVTEKDTATAQTGTYQQGTPQPQTGTYQQGAPQPQQAPYQQGAPQPQQAPYQQGVPQPQQAPYQQAGTYQEPYYGQQAQMGVQSPQKQKKPGKAAGIVGLIFGILGLLTSACGIMVVPLIFCLVGIILAIVCLTKKSSKGLGISGMIVSGLGLISGLIFMFLMVGILSSAGKPFGEMDWEEIINTLEDNSIDDDFDYVPGDYDPVYTEDGFGASEEVLPSSNANLTDVNQIMINGTVYTLPVSFESTGFSVNEKSKDDMDSLAADGWESGEYHFVLLDSADGYSVWGFIENTSDSTVYSESDLKLTGLNVDNYSSACTATSVKIANGVTFGTSKSEVVSLLGDPDSTTDDGVYYDSADGKTELYLEYDGDDKVQCIEITVYED